MHTTGRAVQVRKYSEPIDNGANMLVPVPGAGDGPGGVIVCAENFLIYKNVDHPEVGLGCWAGLGRAGGRRLQASSKQLGRCGASKQRCTPSSVMPAAHLPHLATPRNALE